MQVWMLTGVVESVLLQFGNVMVQVLVSGQYTVMGLLSMDHSMPIVWDSSYPGFWDRREPFGPWLKVHCKYIFSDFYNIKLVLQNLLVKA